MSTGPRLLARLRDLDRAATGPATGPPSRRRAASWVLVVVLYLTALPLLPGDVDVRAVALSLLVLAGAAVVTEGLSG